MEILSPSTAKTDRETKKELYQETFRTPEYFWFDPYTLEFAGFHLVDSKYQPIEPNEKGYLWSQQLGLYLGIHEGLLRYFTSSGNLVPTPEETAALEVKRAERETQRAKREIERAERETQRAERETQRAELEAKRAEDEAQRAERLAAKLRELNINPDTI